jgi:Ca2+-binding RTX toxin-like protein
MGTRRAILPLLLAVAVGAWAPSAQAAIKTRFSESRTLLTVDGDPGKNRVKVGCDALDKVRVNGRLAAGRRVACARVDEVDVIGRGGDDSVDLSGVDERFGRARFRGFGVGTGTAALTGDGDDRMIGSPTAFNLFVGGGDHDQASGGRRRDKLRGGAGGDDLNGRGGRDRLIGKRGGDRLRGGDGKDRLGGNAGADRLFGEAGDDLLSGGPGRDKLRGGAGADRLLGGPGRDRLAGGPGRDESEQD